MSRIVNGPCHGQIVSHCHAVSQVHHERTVGRLPLTWAGLVELPSLIAKMFSLRLQTVPRMERFSRHHEEDCGPLFPAIILIRTACPDLSSQKLEIQRLRIHE